MPSRYKILAVIWFFQITLNFDRVIMAFSGPAILKALALGPQSLGTILSGFAIGYMCGQIPGGLLADRWRIKTMLIVLPVLWGLFTGLTALAATVAGFVAFRACLGLAEGLAVPACFRVIGETFDSQRRTGAMALSSTAGALGPAIAGPIIGLVIAAYGWQAAFYVLAVPPFIAAVLIFLVLPSRRSVEKHPEHTSPAEAVAKPSISTVLLNGRLWVTSFAYFCFNIGYWGYNGWMPTYLATAHHLDIKHLGLIGSIPYVMAFAGLLSFGALGARLQRFRIQTLAIAYLLTGASLFLAFGAGALFGTMLGLCFASFFLSGGIPLFGSMLFDLAPRGGSGSYAGIVFTAGQLGGVFAPFAIGRLVQLTGNFAAGFALMEIALVAGGLAVFLLPFLQRPARSAAN
ncbi:MFS transporter [Novosphingobium sp. SG707]|uniref:MFS transporter n=1 Tax=Novosphingobium sp. SG707 TaxID=2586996 RepID=UPI0014485C65|nr:MFS transporter [Novosphingobium sp. SG707]NKJ00948.1 sugar phosphate permease [Novosphingobium sp. SG707]